MKRTPLFHAHQQLGGKLIGFGGWEMPVQYTSITDEHQAVRTAAGIFDISHMGEVLVTGPGALGFLNQILTNDVRKLAVGIGQYTLMCNERGGVVDDLYAYRTADTEFLLIINASRIDPDVAWIQGQLTGIAGSGVNIDNASERLSAVAIQGPKVTQFIDQAFAGPFVQGTPVTKATELKKNQAAAILWSDQGPLVWVARTGYTGEDGFEVVAPAGAIDEIWRRVMDLGAGYGLKPAGLGARDTLRTEVCYPLYGHELDENTTPIEAGLGFFVALDKGEFTGRAVLARQKEQGTTKRLVAFKMNGRSAPPRPHYPVWSTGPGAAMIGEVVSGTQSPTLGVGIGMAYVPPDFSRPGTALEIEIRGTRAGATAVPKPFYRKLDAAPRP